MAYKCSLCRVYYRVYMVNDHVWNSAGGPDLPTYDGYHRGLCLQCLETRLGRPVVAEDFKVRIPCNYGALLAHNPAEFHRWASWHPEQYLEIARGLCTSLDRHNKGLYAGY